MYSEAALLPLKTKSEMHCKDTVEINRKNAKKWLPTEVLTDTIKNTHSAFVAAENRSYLRVDYITTKI